MIAAWKRRRSNRSTVILAIAISGLVFALAGEVLRLSEHAALRNAIEPSRVAGLLAVDRVADATERHMEPAHVPTEEPKGCRYLGFDSGRPDQSTSGLRA